MADILLKPGTETTLVFPSGSAPVSGARYASNEIIIVANDTASHPDVIQVTVEANGGTATEPVNVFLAQGNTAGDYDGIVASGVDPLSIAPLPNMDPLGSLIMDGSNLMRKSFVARVLKPRFVVVIENGNAAGLTALVVTVKEYNYESV